VLAALFGLRPASAERCRVLELGCGDGTNLLAMAQTLPGSSFIGIDASAAAIERGDRLARAAALANVELRMSALEELPGDLGEFDYIVSHGVYSWVTPRARGALLNCVAVRLAPHGVAYVSYNAYPGSHLRDMTREILRYHVRDVEDPQEQLERAHRLMEVIVAIDDPSLFARALREQMERMLSYSDALLFHDDLAEISTPFYFHEFIQHAAAHGLQFLSEADLAESRMEGVPASAVALFEANADDPLAREQYMDFFRNRTFRRTLLCHAALPVQRALDDRHLDRFTISSPAQPSPDSDPDGRRTFATPDGRSATTSEPLIVAALEALADRWPAGLEFPDLVERALAVVDEPADRADARLRAVMLEAYVARVVQLQSTPLPVCPAAGERPRASPLAREQAAAGLTTVSSLLHTNARLTGNLEPRLLPLLDGTRIRAALCAMTAADRAEVDTALERLASLGLLLA